MRTVISGPCPKCGSENVNETTIGHNGYLEIRCRDCGWHLCSYASHESSANSLDSEFDKLVQRWNSSITNSWAVIPICPSCASSRCSIREDTILENISPTKILRIHCSDCQSYMIRIRTHEKLKEDIEELVRDWNSGRCNGNADMSLLGEGDSDTENPDDLDGGTPNFFKFRTPKEALLYYYDNELHGRHTDCFEFRCELKLLEWVWSRKGLKRRQVDEGK